MTQAPTMESATPLRRSTTVGANGVRVAAATDIAYADGIEGELLEIVRTAADVSSLSGAFMSDRQDWAIRYHLSPARANCLRSLRLPREAVVLEIGAGCGAITRWLGEHVAVVDAVEPMGARAAVARARTRDLPNVEVFQGMVEQVPDEPAYDAVFVIGVLEYVAGGSAHTDPYVEFLAAARRRLRPGGTLVLAIENKLGVKYLAGAPEDHSGLLYHGVEGYHGDSVRARTFDRENLVALVREAGFDHVSVKSLFPDYKTTRVVFDDAVFADVRTAPLTWRIPDFPSSPAGRPTARLISERHLWQSLVEAEVAPAFANSFLLLASDDQSSLWPPSLLASYCSVERHPAFATITELHDEAGLRFHRRRLDPLAEVEQASVFRHHIEDSVLHDGIPLTEFVAMAGEEAIAAGLGAWEDLVRRSCRTGAGAAIDLIPRNVIVSESGELVAIDQEWFSSRHSIRDTLGRGLLYLASDLHVMVHPYRFPGQTVSDLVAYLATMTSLDGDGSWLTGAVRADAELQAFVRSGADGGPRWQLWYDRTINHWVTALERPLTEGPLGRRDATGPVHALAGRPQPLRPAPVHLRGSAR